MKNPAGIEERLQNMEQHLGLKNQQPVHADVYSRLKILEDRILHLESISPEYFDGDVQFVSRRHEQEELEKIDHR